MSAIFFVLFYFYVERNKKQQETNLIVFYAIYVHTYVNGALFACLYTIEPDLMLNSEVSIVFPLLRENV